MSLLKEQSNALEAFLRSELPAERVSAWRQGTATRPDTGIILPADFNQALAPQKVEISQDEVAQIEEILTQEIVQTGEARLPLFVQNPYDHEEVREVVANAIFVMSLPQGSMFEIALALPQAGHKHIRAYAATTGNTLPPQLNGGGKYEGGRFECAMLINTKESNIKDVIPQDLNPANPFIKNGDIDKTNAAVRLHLSAAFAQSFIVNHEGHSHSVLDFNHLTPAISNLLLASYSTDSKMAQDDVHKNIHRGDILENVVLIRAQTGEVRRLLLTQTAQTLTGDPITTSAIYSLKDFPWQNLAPEIVLTSQLVDQAALYRGKIQPLRANIPDAMARLQEIGFARLIELRKEKPFQKFYSDTIRRSNGLV